MQWVVKALLQRLMFDVCLMLYKINYLLAVISERNISKLLVLPIFNYKIELFSEEF